MGRRPTLVGVLLAALAVISACESEQNTETAIAGRWYTASQVSNGEVLFDTHCASCHGPRASGLADDWRKIDSEGNYPPPPLNGTAHAWHHPLVMLEKTLAEGGVEYGGLMPGFSASLTRSERLAIIAYFQSLWSAEIYAKWEAIDAR
jgi:mono/diheme cytochrome c family protein